MPFFTLNVEDPEIFKVDEIDNIRLNDDLLLVESNREYTFFKADPGEQITLGGIGSFKLKTIFKYYGKAIIVWGYKQDGLEFEQGSTEVCFPSEDDPTKLDEWPSIFVLDGIALIVNETNMDDTITTAVLATISAKVTKGTIVRTYNELKEKIKIKLGNTNDVINIIEELEKNSNSKVYQTELRKKIQQYQLEQDLDIIRIVNKLMDKIKILREKKYTSEVLKILKEKLDFTYESLAESLIESGYKHETTRDIETGQPLNLMKRFKRYISDGVPLDEVQNIVDSFNSMNIIDKLDEDSNKKFGLMSFLPKEKDFLTRYSVENIIKFDVEVLLPVLIKGPVIKETKEIIKTLETITNTDLFLNKVIMIDKDPIKIKFTFLYDQDVDIPNVYNQSNRNELKKLEGIVIDFITIVATSNSLNIKKIDHRIKPREGFIILEILIK